MTTVEELTQNGIELLQVIFAKRTLEAITAARVMDADLETVMIEIERKFATTLPGDYFAQIPVHDNAVKLGDVAAVIEQHTDAVAAQLQTVIDAVNAGELGQIPAARH